MRLTRVIALLAMAGALSACTDMLFPPPSPVPEQPACRETSSDAVCVIVLGDSIGAGVPLDGDARWWVRLEDGLRAALPGVPVSVENWAVGRGRIDVLESAATDQPGLGSFDVAIIIEGVNDVEHTSLDEWIRRYAGAVESIESRGVRVVMATPPPNFEDGRLGTRHDAIDEAVRGLATTTRPVLDIAGRFRADGDQAAATYYADNLHQGQAGQQVIADMALEVVLGVLQRPSGG
jgi:lysophospholipase L1-like esterase